jgi:Mg2+ and Co2+ transporter CorA
MTSEYRVNTFLSNKTWINNTISKQDLFQMIPGLSERDLYIIDETLNFRISSYSIKKHVFMIKFDFIRAIVTKDKVYFINTKNQSKSYLLQEGVFRNISKAFIACPDEKDKVQEIQAQLDARNMSFENRIMECILMSIDMYYTNLLNKMIPKSSHVINSDKDGDLKTIFELKKELISIRFAIKDIYDLLVGLHKYDIDGFEGFLNKETYEQFIDTIETNIRHFEENVDSLDKINDWLDLKLQMVDIDSSRLRTKIDKINLLFSIIIIALTTCSLITGIFGMNLINKLETNNNAFYSVLIAMGILFAILFVGIKKLTFDKIHK